MTEDQTPQVTPAWKNPTVVTQSPDAMLYELAISAQMSNAEGRDAALAVIVSVKGTLISGMLRGRNDWFKRLREFLATQPQDMSELGDQWTTDYTFDPTDEARLDSESFVHLTDARYVLGGGFAPSLESAGVFARVRLADVDAWSLGSFDTTLG